MHFRFRQTLLVFSLALPVLLHGQAGGKEERHDFDPWLPSWFRIGGQARVRFEDPAGAGFVTGSGGYALTRLRLNAAVRPASWLKLFAEVQDTRALHYGSAPPPSMRDPFDLRAAYVHLGREGSPLALTAGRQEVHLGSGRLIGTPDWGNTSRSFDALRGAVSVRGMRLEILAGSVVAADGARLDRHKPGEHVFASYNTFARLLPNASVEPYFIVKTARAIKDERGTAGDAAVYTGGVRLGGKKGGLEYSAETIRQWGGWSGDSVSAGAGTYLVGWSFGGSRSKPRISADYSHASGDRGPKDYRRGGFDSLYGNQQPFFSTTGLFGWRNLRDLRAGLDWRLAKNVRANLDFRDYALATTADGLYNSSLTRVVYNPAAASRHVGQGVEAGCVWTLAGSTQLSFGAGQVFAGAYLRQSGKGGFLYPYAALLKRF